MAGQTIFIQIASYRDPELLPTMRDAVEKAKYPNRLTFGVCFQERREHPYYRQLLDFPGCRVIQVEPEEAKGTCAARALTQTLWQGEAYTLQIDSHARFVQDWDEILLSMHKLCGEKAILTAYCPAYEPDEPLVPNPTAYTLGADFFNAYGSLMLLARMSLNQMAKPVPGAFWSGHFSFADAKVIEDIPYDPNLYFHGEEITYAVRAWTHGYNLFYPNQSVCYHFYSREGRSKHWDEQKSWFSRNVMSQQRVRRLLGMEESNEAFGIYGLGNQRSQKEYEQWSGVDFAARYFNARAWSGWYSEEYPHKPNSVTVKNAPQQDILFATAFCETGREKWMYFRRDKALYLEWFSYLAVLKNLSLVCYYPEESQNELPPGGYILRDFDRADTFFQSYFEDEKAIMQSTEFKQFIGERGKNPEHCHPEYAMMTHSKANFVRRASQQFQDHSHYAWIDFGIVRCPLAADTVFDWSHYMDDKIHMQVFAPPEQFPSDPRELCQKSPDALSASLFVIPKSLVIWYEGVYEQELQINHTLKIADDEQNIMLRLAQKYPDKISADCVTDWYSFFTAAQV